MNSLGCNTAQLCRNAVAGSDCTGEANPRYGYAGAWGYQSQNEFPFLHIGARYYDPATGRFLQRDPIGIVGALNVYEYVGGSPTAKVDPTGLVEMWNWNRIEHYQPGRKPSTSQSVEDMQRELDRANRRVKFAKWGLVCIGGGWAIYARSIVAGAFAAAGASQLLPF
jgi:RHS repeat-associated protein